MSIYLKILSPEGVVSREEEVDLVEVLTVDGPIVILPNHAPIISLLEIGILRYKKKDEEYKVLIGDNGFLEMSKNELTVIANTAENEDDIDLLRANKAKDRLENFIKEGGKVTDDGVLAEIALKKAILRIKLKQK